MGAVYLASDRNLPGQQVAIKQSLKSARPTQQQFRREADMLASLNHRNLPRVTNFFIDRSGFQYLVMDYIDGDDLRQIISAHPEPLDERIVVEWLNQLLDALEYMHNWHDPKTGVHTPIIHRDIKPGNIKQALDGRIVLVDFGIAKVATSGETLTGARARTPGYSPVEQYTGGGTDIRSDIYALGATVYCLLTRTVPPEAPDIAAKTATLYSPRMLNPSLSRNIDSVIMRAMKTQPAERYQSIPEMRNALTNRWPEIRVPISLGLLGSNPANTVPESGTFPKTTTQSRRPTTSTSPRPNYITRTSLIGLILVALFSVVFILFMLAEPIEPPLAVIAPTQLSNSVASSPTLSNSEDAMGETTTPTDAATPNGDVAMATHTPLSNDTPTEIALARNTEPPTSTPIVETVSTPTSQPSSQPSSTPTSTPTSEPSSTPTRNVRTATHTPTEVPTNTPTSTVTRTQFPSLPTLTSTTAPVTAPPALRQPSTGSIRLVAPLGSVLQGTHDFQWESTITLQPEEGYELVFWEVGRDPFRDGFSPIGARKASEVRVNLDSSIQTLSELSAGREYYWGVLLVILEEEGREFERLRFLDEQHLFRLESQGSSDPTETPTPRG